ncbi:MAG: penicillin-binding protein 1B [Gammaproteobacteria bacterium]
MLILLVIGSIPLAIYTMHVSSVVTKKFEGKRWAVPARVYARSLELYAGSPVTSDRLQSELKLLGYRQKPQADRTGTWAVNGNRMLVNSRPFRFWDGEEPAQALDVRFGDGGVESLRDRRSGAEIDLVRMEPLEIGSIYPSHNEDRVILSYAQIPKMLEKTLLEIEDRRFYGHFGIDPIGTTRALYNTIVKGKTQGGSTITQQLVKNLYLTRERRIKRKLREAHIALILEYHYSKEDILAAYANEIYLGQDGNRGIHGFGLASDFFFGVPVNELDIHQIALLVGLIKAPSDYNPRRNPERAMERRNLVIDVLSERGVISESQANAAKQKPLGVIPKKKRSGGGRYPAFMDLVKRQLDRDYEAEDLNSEGLRIFTTMDPWVQNTAEQNVASRLAELEKQKRLKQGTLEVGAVIATPLDGEILAVIGGRQAAYDGFNRALDATRQIGSLVKPAVYLAALQQPEKYALSTILDDRQLVLSNGSKRWAPHNYDKKEHGRVPLERALAKSYNLATVRLGLDVGIDNVVKTLHALGMSEEPQELPSLLLGALNMTPLEVTQIYQSIASGGYRTPLRAIREVMDQEGNPLSRYPLTVKRTVPDGPVYLVTRAMQEVVKSGTATYLGRVLPASLHIAGKTGTTDNLRDSWFAGFTGNYVTVVWVGRDDNKSARLTGSSGALRVWADIMKPLKPEPLELMMPDTIELALVDPVSGMMASELCEKPVEKPFVRGYTPLELAPCANGYTGDIYGNRNAVSGSDSDFLDEDGHPDYESNNGSRDTGAKGRSSRENGEKGLSGFLRSIFQ